MCCRVEEEKTGNVGPRVAEVWMDLESEHHTSENQSRTVGTHWR